MAYKSHIILPGSNTYSYTSNFTNYSKVDHLKLDMSSTTTKKLFGTTRSSDFDQKGFHINVFIIKLKANFEYDYVETF